MKITKYVLAVLLIALTADSVLAGPLLPTVINKDGSIQIVKDQDLPRPPKTIFSQIYDALVSNSWAAGFDAEVVLSTAFGYDGAICTSTGSFGGMVVPRCTNGDGTFYVAYGIPPSPSAAPSFTVSFDVNNAGGETTSGNAFCYKASCAVILAGGANANSASSLTYATASALQTTSFSGCNASNTACVGNATAAFNCSGNDAVPANCGTSDCLNHLAVFKIQPTKTACTSATTVAIDYGLAHFNEAN